VEDSIEFTDEIDTFIFIPPKDGVCSFTISGLQTDRKVSLFLTDEGGGTITSDTWLGNDQGIKTDQIHYEKTYFLKVEQSKGFSPYNVTVNYSSSD